MEQEELQKLLEGLLSKWESEVVEFKQTAIDTDKIGKYFSALANAANVRGLESAWLVFGVDNSTHKVVGTQYRRDPEKLQGIKMQVSQDTSPRITFRNVFELPHPGGRVLMFEIPAAPQGMPIAWKGHYYARAGESLTPLGLDKQDEIRQQTFTEDWSAQIVSKATSDHLDGDALNKARTSFADKHAERFPKEEVSDWPLDTFLDRAKLTQDGKITRAALLLLGKAESSYLLSPHPAQITWKLEGQERAYAHFGLPFLLNTTELYRKIRNIQIRILPDDQLLPTEVSKYDQRIVLETLHNCIAHQDYSRSGRIIVTEQPDQLIFENEGRFFEGQPGDYILGTKTPRRYRNPFLTQAMTELNMIDTMGYGIHSIHRWQAERYFPMPDYDLTEPKAVKVTIYGKLVDLAYSRLLLQKTNLPLDEILALDRVQKRLPLPDDMLKRLRRDGLIEGRKPNLHVSASIAEVTTQKADYIRTRAQDDDFYCKLITDFLTKFSRANRKEVNNLLDGKLSEALSPDQQARKISSLLTRLRRRGVITNEGSTKKPSWKLVKSKVK